MLMLLRFYTERIQLCDEIAYWSPAEAAATEVDFVLLRRREIAAIEVKATHTLRPNDLRGLRAIAGLPELRRRILVFTGERPVRTEDGIDVLPFQTFAEQLSQGKI